MSIFSLFVFFAGVFVGFVLTCILISSDDSVHRDEEALIYQAGWSEGYRAGKKEREK